MMLVSAPAAESDAINSRQVSHSPLDPEPRAGVGAYYRDAFLKTASEAVISYVEKSAGLGLTHKANLAAFTEFRIRPRMLRGSAKVSPLATALGRSISAPVMLAPVAWNRFFTPDGEITALRAACEFGTNFVVSAFSSLDFTALKSAANGRMDNVWYQLLLHREKDTLLHYIERAKSAGCAAIVLTVDAPAGCQMCKPRQAAAFILSALNPHAMPLLPKSPRISPGNSIAEYYANNLSAETATWEFAAEVIKDSSLPVFLKGVLRGDDAAMAESIGAAGVIISNHGGRQLDSALSTLAALAEIGAAKRSGRLTGFPLYMDGGIRTGCDIFKALALGADAVFIGRPLIYALGAAGQSGVEDLLCGLKAELLECMALAGCSSAAEISQNELALKTADFSGIF